MIREALAILEAAKGLEKYALYLDKDLTILYVPDEELRNGLEEYDVEGLDDKILLAFGIREEIHMDAVWAQKGFGPLAYKIAMQLQGEMAPFWMERQVTPAAARVWKEFFDGKGSNDVNKTLTGVSPDNYRHYSYSLKKKLNLNKNIRIHTNFIGKDPYNEKLGMLKEMAEGQLRSSMRSIY